MAWRSGRKGQWLATDDNSGITHYASELREGYYGEMAKKPLLRNLQEVASPLSDPYPVSFYRGPNYEASVPCNYEIAPTYVGNTTIPTNRNNAAAQALALFPSIGTATIGCTFRVA